MNKEELQQYIERVGFSEVPPTNAEGLADLQRAHLANVPFENLDIVDGKIPLALDEASLFDKIVRRRRGGICYEMNLLLAEALRVMGFGVALKGAQHPKYGDDMDHLFLMVKIPNSSVPDEQWLTDVGFASNFAVPLRFVVGEMQNDGINRYLLEEAPDVGEGYVRLWCIPGLNGEGNGDAERAEMFSFGPREFEPQDCRERCNWFCMAPESRFTQGPLVTKQGADGRRTLSANHYIETRGGERMVVDIESSEQYEAYLKELLA